MEAEDEFHARGPVKARSVLLEVVEHRVNGNAGVEGAGGAQLFDPHQFDVGQNEVARPRPDGAYAALVGRPRCPAVLNTAHHRRAVVLCEVLYGVFVVCTRGAHEVERCAPVVRFVDRIREDYSVGAAGGCPSEGEAEEADDKHLVEPLKIAIFRL